ncbi:MAG: hypothetical protein R6U70_02520, partial [Bacillota bacterium]
MFSSRRRNMQLALAVGLLLAAGGVWAHLSWGTIAATTEVTYPDSGAGKAVLVLAPNLTSFWLSGAGPPGDPLGEWGGALVNVRTGGGGSPSDAAASISAGARAFGLNDLITAAADAPVWEVEAAEIFASWYDETLPAGGAAVLDHPRLAAAQSRLSHEVRVGALADAFRDAGREVAFMAGVSSGAGLLAAADSRGIVDHYAQCVVQSVHMPGGWRTDWERLGRSCLELPAGVGLVVIEAADLDLLGGWLPDSVSDSQVSLFARGLVALAAEVGDGASVWVVDPLPGEAEVGLMLAPGHAGQLLISPTTRRPGIVSLQDAASTLLAAAGLPEEVGFGRAVGAAGAVPRGGEVLTHLRQLAEALEGAGVLRVPLAQGMATAVVAVSLLILASQLWMPRFLTTAVRCLGGISLVPLAAFLSPALAGLIPDTAALLLTWLALLITARALAIALGFRGAVVTLAGGGLAAILADQLAGARWALLSPLGYSAAAGARYYGLGNEFLGVMLGATVLVWALEVRPEGAGELPPGARPGEILRGAALLAASVVAAGPRWGSNFGGAAVFAAWLSWAGARHLHPRPSLLPGTVRRAWRPAAVGLAAAGCLVAALMWHSGAAPVSSSHVGRLLAGGTGDTLLQVVIRKLSTGVRLFRYTVWTRIWLFILALYAAVTFRPFG